MNHYSDQSNPNILFQQRLVRLSRYFAIGVLIIGGLVLAGWKWDIVFLRQPIRQFTAMNPLSAVSFVLLALSFFGSSPLLVTPSTGGPVANRKKTLGIVLAVIVLLIGILKIAVTTQLLHFSVDRILFSEKFTPAIPDYLVGRMATISHLCLTLSAMALLLLHTAAGRGRMLSQYMALLVGLLGMFSLVGYLYRVHTFYGIFRYTPMAIHSATCFVFLSLCLLLSQPDKGLMKEFTSTNSGGLTARRLLPLVILLPVLLGYIRLWGYWQGWFSTEFGVTILVSSIVLIFGIVIWYNARIMNKRDILKKEADEILHQSEGRYRLLVSNVKDYAIFMLNPEGNIVSWNDGAERIKGYSAEEIIGKGITVFYTKEDLDRNEPAHNLEQARRNGRFEKEGWRVRKDGSAFWANVVFSALYDPKGKFMGYTKVTRDITERKKSEEQIAYMARLMEDISDAIFSTDIHFNIRTWNKAAELLYGYSLAEVKGKPGTEVLRTQMNQEIRLAIREEMLKGGYWKGEVNYLKKDDSKITILLSASSVRNAVGEMDGFVMVCRDISERKKMEDQLMLFNKNLEVQVKEKTAELTGIFERITDAFIAVDKNFCYTYLNKKAGELIRHDPATLIGRNVWDIFPDAVGSDTYKAFNKAMDEQRNLINIDYYSPLDLWQENHFYPSPEGLSVFIRNITDQKKKEGELEDAHQLLRHSYEEIRQLASHLQDIREEERAGIAREIHDELGQQLTGIKMDLSWVLKKMPIQDDEPIAEKLKGTLDLLDNTIKTVRRIATELRPSILDDLGLIAAIEWQSLEFQKRSGIATEFSTEIAEFKGNPTTAIGLFRICQESLTNIARHAGAHKVCVSLQEKEDNAILLKIEDDGKGFQAKEIGYKKTLGLLGMKERALMMGGHFDICSQPGKGTILSVDVPLLKDAN